jgi:hypothetical protein
LSILVRPVREQLEHDRVIRLLQAKWKKRFDVEANVGDERTASLKVGQLTVFPDLALYSPTVPRRLQGVVEVETGESINHLEAMAQWTHMSRARAPFQLYVPVNSIDQARRLCADQHVALAELWSYFVFGEQVRLTLVHRDEALAEVPPAPKGSTPVTSKVVVQKPAADKGTPAQKVAAKAAVPKAKPAAPKAKAVAPKAKAAAPKGGGRSGAPGGKAQPPVRKGTITKKAAAKPQKGAARVKQAPRKAAPAKAAPSARAGTSAKRAKAPTRTAKASKPSRTPASRAKKASRR